MPQTTPIYSFPYPCEGEDITVASFANLANAIDTKLTQLASDEFEALNRYNQQNISASNIINPGVDTVIAGANSTYTIPAAGVWVVDAATLTLSTPATMTSMRIRVRKNGVVQYGSKQNAELFPLDTMTTGMFTAAAGDTISFQVLYTGTGTWSMTVFWAAIMFVRIA